MKTTVTQNTLSTKGRELINGTPAPDAILLIPEEETEWIQYTEEAIEVIPRLDREEIQDVSYHFDETDIAYDIVRPTGKTSEYMLWVAREWCDDVTEAIETETCTRLITPNIEMVSPRAIEYAVRQNTHVIGFNDGLTFRGDRRFNALSDGQRRALGIDTEPDSDDTKSHDQDDTREKHDAESTGATESEPGTEPSTEDSQEQDPDTGSNDDEPSGEELDELSAEELLAGIEWNGGRPPIGCTSEAGILKPDDTYTDVRDALRRVARDEMSQSAAADKLDCTRKTIANALQRPHLYGIDSEQV